MANKKAGSPQTVRFIRECLGERGGEGNTRQIYEFLIRRTKQAPTMHELGAMLGKSKHFMQIGFDRCSGVIGGAYQVAIWAETIESE
jgi:hypothetical protein